MIDLRRTALNVETAPGVEHLLVFTFPADYLDGTTWTATCGTDEEGDPLACDTDITGDTLTVTVPPEATEGRKAPQDLLIIDAAGSGFTGDVWPRQSGTDSPTSTELTVTVGEVDIAVTLVATGPAGADGGGGGAVDSVNGQTGVVVLDAAAVGAVASPLLDANIPATLARDTEVTAAVAAEAVTRAAADADEASARASADASLDGRLDILEAVDPLTQGEGDARYWPLATNLATQAELDAEATTRGDADTALDGRLDILEAVSGATDAELAAAVAAEAVLARNADNLTSGTVADARIAATIARDSEVTSAVAAEATARDTAISTAVAAEATLARNADNLTSGTVADARIASTIARDSEVAAGYQPLDTDLTTIAANITAAGHALLDDADATAQRTTLGLGNMATQAKTAVDITGGTVVGITDVAVADGGTGASTASGARTNLGLVIGTDVQAFDADTAAIAALTSAADKVPYATGAQAWSLATFTAFARTLVDDADAAAARVTLGVPNIAGDTFTGEVIAPDFKATGKTGATATPLLLAGGTASGAPTTGAHVVGELIYDALGFPWYCTVAGTPGTWVCTASGREIFHVEQTLTNETTTSTTLVDLTNGMSGVLPVLPVPVMVEAYCRAQNGTADKGASLQIIRAGDSAASFNSGHSSVTNANFPLVVRWRIPAGTASDTYRLQKAVHLAGGTATFFSTSLSPFFLRAVTC